MSKGATIEGGGQWRGEGDGGEIWRGDMAAKMGNGVWRGAEGQQGTLAPFLTEPIACSVECGKGNQRKNNRFQHKE
jgi:hypothetical protein